MSTFHPHFASPTSRLALGCAALVLGAACAAGAAQAQPTGNPAGTRAPRVIGDAEKSPATNAPHMERRGPAHGESSTNPESRAARSGNLRQPGIGTTGGLTGSHPGTRSENSTTWTTQAPPVPPRDEPRREPPPAR